MTINPITLKERIALGEWSAEERDFLLNAVNHMIDTLASRGGEPAALYRIRQVLDETPSFTEIEKVILRHVLDAYAFSIVRGRGVEFRLGRHTVKPGVMIEVWRDGKFVAAIYPTPEGVQIDSAHLIGYDDGRSQKPPVARVAIAFQHASERKAAN